MYAATASVYLFALNILFPSSLSRVIARAVSMTSSSNDPAGAVSAYLTAPCGSPLPNMAVNANWGTHGSSERPKPSISATNALAS